MRRIFLVMITFGLLIGFAFPFAVDPFVTWDPERKLYFRITCLAAGFAVGAFCYFLVRITLFERNRLLANQKRELEKAKAEWETSFNALSEGVVVVDASCSIIHANRSFATMLGCDEETLPGKPAAEMARKRGWGDDCLLESAMQDGEHLSGESTTNGRIFEQSADPVLDDMGRITGCVGVLRDMTDDRRLRQELIQTAKMAAVGRLVSGAAHELNNPLTGVTALTELLLRRNLDDETRCDLEKISCEGARAVDIVAHLLSFVRNNRSEPVATDPNQLLSDALALKSYDLNKAGVEVVTNLTRFPVSIVADPTQLKQVFINIIDNAIDSLRAKGGNNLRLTASVEPRDHELRVHFMDNGTGVPVDVREQIFDPFFTTRDIGQGTGLGLSVCFGIIEEHHGRIWLESDCDTGAHFVIEIPAAAAAAA
ncbi:MAG: PAS domain-containing protein [Actinobacteria bacterium]|nr:PAS domain-containing protein [Actinomycetota bacterium]